MCKKLELYIKIKKNPIVFTISLLKEKIEK